MDIRVIRTSHFGRGEGQPCPEAVASTYTPVEAWPAGTPARVRDPAAWEASWFGEGANHRTETDADGRAWILRDMPPRPCWRVRLDSLDDLVAFMDRHGDLVLQRERGEDPVLEIYDYYRE